VVARVLLTGLLVAACVSDLRSRRIPNGLVVIIGLTGLGYALTVMPPTRAFVFAFGGGVIGLAIWLPFWALRVLGAGDVKLMSAAGTWLGAAGAVEASLIAAVVGGLMAIAALARVRSESSALARFGTWLLMSRTTQSIAPELTPEERRVPYGVALAAGAAVVAWCPGLIW
jgi:prepilin peptidase CpaA